MPQQAIYRRQDDLRVIQGQRRARRPARRFRLRVRSILGAAAMSAWWAFVFAVSARAVFGVDCWPAIP